MNTVFLRACALAASLVPAAFAHAACGDPPGVPAPVLVIDTGSTVVHPTIKRANVECAIKKLKPLLERTLHDTGLPGLAIGVVFDDQVIWSQGYGVREVGKPEPIDEHSLFQLASMSKPIGSTVIAKLVGDHHLDWDDPIVKYTPDFALADPWVTQHVTVADMYSHRSGLPDHAGEELEELGYSREEILSRLRLDRLDGFRDVYAYTNYGLTAAAVAAAASAHMTWEDASRELLYKPAGMTSTTSSFDDYLHSPQRAVPHVFRDPDAQHPHGYWSADYQQKTDPGSPAMGVASTVADLMRWMRLQLNGGMLDGKRIVDEAALKLTHTPHSTSQPLPSYTARPNAYGLGWFVDTDDVGQVRWSHAGTFQRGGATTVNLVPAQKLGIVVLTNGYPLGIPESTADIFLDLVFFGEPRTLVIGGKKLDWYEYRRNVFLNFLDPQAKPDYSKPPSHALPAQPIRNYLGRYHNDYYGDLDVVLDPRHRGLVMVMGPDRLRAERIRFPLEHYSGDTFWYTPPGGVGVVPTPVTFTLNGNPAKLTLGRFDLLHMKFDDNDEHGPFVRAPAPQP